MLLLGWSNLYLLELSEFRLLLIRIADYPVPEPLAVASERSSWLLLLSKRSLCVHSVHCLRERERGRECDGHFSSCLGHAVPFGVVSDKTLHILAIVISPYGVLGLGSLLLASPRIGQARQLPLKLFGQLSCVCRHHMLWPIVMFRVDDD